MKWRSHPVRPKYISRSFKLEGKLRFLIAAILSSDVVSPKPSTCCPNSAIDGKPKYAFLPDNVKFLDCSALNTARRYLTWFSKVSLKIRMSSIDVCSREVMATSFAQNAVDLSLCVQWSILEAHDCDIVLLLSAVHNYCELVPVLMLDSEQVKEARGIDRGEVLLAFGKCGYVRLKWHWVRICHCHFV